MTHKRTKKSKLNVLGTRRTVKSVAKDIKLATKLRTGRENLRHLQAVKNINSDEKKLMQRLLSAKKFI